MNTAMHARPIPAPMTCPEQRWPNFYLVGAMKAGTTTIADVLGEHPDVFLSPVKEPNFFSRDLAVSETGAGDGTNLDLADGRQRQIHAGDYRDKDAYLALFKHWKDQKIGGECSTSYLCSQVAAEEIARRSPDAKILIVLRNPVERAFSEFVMNCSIGVAMPPFAKFLDLEREQLAAGNIPRDHKYVTAGLYYRQISRYLQLFPPEQVEILLYDDMKLDFAAFMERVCSFLAIDSLDAGKVVRSNAAKYPRWAYMNMLLKKTGVKHVAQGILPEPAKRYLKQYYYRSLPRDITLNEADRQRLHEEFAGDTAQLSRLIKRDLSSWLA